MGFIAYNFLLDSCFFDQNSIENKFKDYSDDSSLKVLERYRNHSKSK